MSFWVIFWGKTHFQAKKHFSAKRKNAHFSVIPARTESVVLLGHFFMARTVSQSINRMFIPSTIFDFWRNKGINETTIATAMSPSYWGHRYKKATSTLFACLAEIEIKTFWGNNKMTMITKGLYQTEHFYQSIAVVITDYQLFHDPDNKKISCV